MRGHYDMAYKFMVFLIIAGGSAAFAEVVGWSHYLGAAVALVAVAELVWAYLVGREITKSYTGASVIWQLQSERSPALMRHMPTGSARASPSNRTSRPSIGRWKQIAIMKYDARGGEIRN